MRRDGEPPRLDPGADAAAGTGVSTGAGTGARSGTAPGFELNLELLAGRDGDPGEVLDAGGASRPPGRVRSWFTGRIGGRGRAWLALHRGPATALGTALTAVLLVPIAIAAVDSLAGPALPAVTAADLVLPRPDQPDLQPSWAPLPNGRPSSPVTVTLTARLALRIRPGQTVQLLGPDGPGIVATTGEPVAVGADGRVRSDLVAQLDCEQVPIPVPADAYGVRVRVRDASGRASVGVVGARDVGRGFGRQVQNACGPWLARRHLTVVAAAARTDPVQPSADLDLTIRNDGAHPGRLEFFGDPEGLQAQVVAGAGDGVQQVPLPAHRDTVVHLRLAASDCDGITADVSGHAAQPDRPVTSADLLRLAADVAPAPDPTTDSGRVPPWPDPHTYGDGYGSTGILLAPTAVDPVVAAVSHLCADLAPVVTLLNAVHPDAAHHRLTVDLSLDLQPGRVSSVTLAPGPAGDDHAFVPLWTPRTGLVPDRSGEVRVLLPYAPPPGTNCPYPDGWMPPVTLVAQVPVPGGVRVVRFAEQGFEPPDAEALAALCHR